MFPGTICFERFDYPSQLSSSIQQRMESIAKEFIRGIQLDNSLFNIEFMYNPDKDEVHIIEVNPRMSSQFADLYEKVDGINLYQILLDIGLGAQPKAKKKQGKYPVASSFVLRSFENKHVLKAPSEEELSRICQLFPDTYFRMVKVLDMASLI
jgi:biotin carboxylase